MYIFLIHSEVQKALATARSLFARWRELQEDPSLVSREEVEYTTNELRNSLRSIEWDLEDLEETVNILVCFRLPFLACFGFILETNKRCVCSDSRCIELEGSVGVDRGRDKHNIWTLKQVVDIAI